MLRVAHVPAHHFDEGRIALGGPDGGHMPDAPQHETGDPQAQAEADRRGEGAVEDGESAWRAGKQDRLGQRAMQRRFETGKEFVRSDFGNYTSAPPPNEKNDRKNDDAANAIDRPNTI